MSRHQQRREQFALRVRLKERNLDRILESMDPARRDFFSKFAMRLFAAMRLAASGSFRKSISARMRASKSSGERGRVAITASQISGVMPPIGAPPSGGSSQALRCRSIT